MKPYDELKLELAKFLHEYWKEFARPLLLGSHLSETKHNQYAQGMCKWFLLQDKYKKIYLRDADSILRTASCNVATLADHFFNSET